MNGAEFMYDLSLNEKGISFKELEKKIYKYACDTACELMKSVLETLDQKLMVERDTKLYRNKGIRKTCVKTIMGDVEYSRRIYEIKQDDGRKVTKYLLDEYLNMDIIGNISVNLTESILNNITEVSYRKTSDNIKNMCNQEISPQAVWNVVQTFGRGIAKLEDRKIELDQQEALCGDKKVPVLFQEQDGLWLSIQRRADAKDKKKRAVKKELKLGASYVGWKKRTGSNKEFETVDKILCASFKPVNHFKKLCNATINEVYNVDGISLRVLNGDGASWIKKSCEDNNIYFQLDPFHIAQAITKNVKDKTQRKQLLKLFRKGEPDKGLEILKQMLIEANNDEKEFKKLSDLYNYLSKNKEGLIPYKQRANIEIPSAPEGIEYRQMGTMESSIFSTLAKRMKGRRMSWSVEGADNLAKILCEQKNKRLSETVDKIYKNIIPESVLRDVIINTPLSAKKVDAGNNKPDIYPLKTASIPYSSAAVTLGRKVIRNLCGLKDFGDLSYT